MIASETAEINEMIRHAAESIGGRGTAQVIHQELLAIIAASSTVTGPLAHLVTYSHQTGLLSLIKSWMRVKGADGLPRMPAINARHEHAFLDLFTRDEYKYVIRKHIDSSDAEWSVAKTYAAKYHDVFNEALDLHALRAERRAS